MYLFNCLFICYSYVAIPVFALRTYVLSGSVIVVIQVVVVVAVS